MTFVRFSNCGTYGRTHQFEVFECPFAAILLNEMVKQFCHFFPCICICNKVSADLPLFQEKRTILRSNQWYKPKS